MSANPYSSPKVSPVDESSSKPDSEETHEAPALVVEHLRGTRPWVKFCSLAGYVTSMFILLIAVVMIQKLSHSLSLTYLYLLGAFYFTLSILFFIPSMRLSQYERAILRLAVTNQVGDLEIALAHQRTFWKQMAMMILILLILYLVTIALSAIMLLSRQ